MSEIKQCRVCKNILNSENTIPSFLKREINICRKCDQQASSDRLAKNRIKVIIRLGHKCQCCGVDDYELLSIDHIAGEGIKDRHSFKNWKNYIKHLLKLPINELLLKYRCLCYNCNYTRGFWGKCPHEFSTNLIPKEMLIVADRGKKNTHLSNDDYNKRRIGVRRIIKLVNRLEMINAYGGKCVQCKETNPLFLTLDHINNTGYLETSERGSGFYQYLKSFGYPGKGTQLQLMCHNCNAKKEYIDRRLHKNVIVNTLPEIYISQSYYISKEEKLDLQNKARELYYLINNN